MITHYLKVAVRNLLKYKTQTIVSLLGLAAGFACMALSVYWNHYEMTYDADQSNVDRIYAVRETSPFTEKVSTVTPGPLAGYLMETYPEVEAACTMKYLYLWNPQINGIPIPSTIPSFSITPEALKMFDFEWKAGDKNMEGWNEKQVAITEHFAKQMCGDTSPIGQKIVCDDVEYEIVGVFKDWPIHSNFHFDIIGRLQPDNQWGASSYSTYAMLRPDTDAKNFLAKATTDTIQSGKGYAPHLYDVWIPLQKVRYIHPEGDRNIKLEDVRLFTMASILIVVCALLNYLTLFISRLRGKGRILALRTVYGSSGTQTGLLLMTEYMLLLVGAWLVGMLFVEISMSSFMELAQITISRFYIYQACGWLIAFIILLSALLSWLPILFFKRKTLAAQITPSVRGGKNHFRLASVCIQLVFSLLFIFCSVVMMKQIHYLTTSDINIRRTNIGWFSSRVNQDRAIHLLKQLPCIDEALPMDDPLFPQGWGTSHGSARQWTGKGANDENVPFQWFTLTDSIARFYGLKMKEGPTSFDLGKDEIIINETFAKHMKMDNPVGKTVNNRYRIKGVMEDFQCQRPTEKVQAMAFHALGSTRQYLGIRYNGNYDNLMKNLTEAFANEEFTYFEFKDGEQTYNDYLKSENNLLKLLGITTLVSLLIALFGIYALIVQSCEQHRKEIAIRKVNGAKVTDILAMFFKQYMLQVLVASAIAFPIGYVLMKRWLEGYSRQTEISFWIFIGIFLLITAAVSLCISWKIWKAANENPAEVIKSE